MIINKQNMAYISISFTETGGGAKTIALRVNNSDIFNSRIIAGANKETRERAEMAFSLPNGIIREVDISQINDAAGTKHIWDLNQLRNGINGCSAVVVLAGLVNNTSEWMMPLQAANDVGTKVKIIDTILGIGNVSLAKEATAILSVSKDMMRDVGWSAGDKLFCCHPAVTKKCIKIGRSAFRKKFNIPEDAFVVGSPLRDGFFLPLKEVAAFCQKTGSYYLGVMESENLHENFRSCGFLSQEDIGDFYDSIDVLVHLRTESFGFNVVEAILAKKPIVALWTNSNNGFGEFIWPNAGYFARDSDGIIDALLQVHYNYDLAKEMANNAYNNAIQNVDVEIAKRRFDYIVGRTIVNMNDYEDCEKWAAEQSPDLKKWLNNRMKIESYLLTKSFI